MTILESIIQGIIQGLTEFLPVSSSGHLSLFQHFFGLSGESGLFFSVMLHVGTLLAVFIAFWKTIWSMIVEFFRMLGQIFKGQFRYKDANESQKLVLMVLLSLVPLVLFFFVKDWFTALSEDNDIIVEGFCFLFTGCMLFMADRSVKGNRTAVNMKPRDALWLGTMQGIAAMPGISRSGSTTSLGLMRGFSREFVVKFSFIMSIPAIVGASLFEALDAFKTEIVIDPVVLIVGMVVSAVVGFFAIKMVAWLVKTDKYVVFAYYTLILGVLTLLVGFTELFTGQNIVTLVSGWFA